MFLATDLNGEALAETAGRAARKQSRGGAPNLLCIAEPVEVLAEELTGAADRVTAILPWGSLLRALVTADAGFLSGLHRLCAPGATLEIVMSYDPLRDATAAGPLGEAAIQESVLHGAAGAYDQAGLPVCAIEKIQSTELGAYQTTWAGRLAHGRPREIWRIRAQRDGR